MCIGLPLETLQPLTLSYCLCAVQVRGDAGIVAKSEMEILCAEGDMYVARITGKKAALTIKMGPRYSMGDLLPDKEQGWEKAAKGKDYCVWMKVLESVAGSE